MKRTTKWLLNTATILSCSISAITLDAQSVAASVNGVANPADEFWLASSVGWFYTPTSSFTLIGINTKFFLSGGSDRNVTIELLSAPRFDGGSLLASTTFNTSAARGVFGGGVFASSFAMVANTQYFIGFRNMAPPGAGDFDLVPESELLRANYTGDAGESLGVMRFDFENDGQYQFESDDGPNTQPILQFVQQDIISTVPEPSTIWMTVVGLASLGVMARRRRRV